MATTSKYQGMFEQQKQHLMFYGQKLGIEIDTINEIYFPTLIQLDEILKKEAEPYLAEWDKNEVTLDDAGKVIFSPSLVKLYDIIIKSPKGFRFYESIVPEEYGGLGFPALMLGSMLETMASYDISLNGTLGMTTTIIEALDLEKNKELSEKYMPIIMDGAPGFVGFSEAGAGSNLKNVKSTSQEEGDYFILKGTKIFVTNAGFGELGIILTRNMVNGEAKGTNAFLVHTPTTKDVDDSSKLGIRAIKLEKKLGIHSSPTGVLEMNALVPKENLLGVQGKGYQTVLERLMGMRMGVSFQGSAIAERAYQMANEYAKDRVQFGKPIGTFAGVANKLRGMEINLTRMRKFAYEGSFVLSKFQMGQSLKSKKLKLTLDEEKIFEEHSAIYNRGMLNHTISKAKMYNTEVAFMMVDDALQIFGGNGYIVGYKIEKLLRDSRILRIYEGTSEIQEYILNSSKGVAMASNMSELMEISMNPKGFTNPEHYPLDYQDIFFRRFGSVMDVFLDDNGDTRYLYDD